MERRRSPRELDPDYWENRAEEARAIATQFKDPVAQRTMLQIAEGYERLEHLARSKIGGTRKDRGSSRRSQ